MQIRVSIDDAKLVSPGLWTATLSPENIRQLGSPAAELGSTSVLLLDDPQYDQSKRQISFPMNAVRVLNAGTSEKAILLDADDDTSSVSKRHAPAASADSPRLGMGDRQLLQKVEHFPDEMKAAARTIVELVRRLDPSGDFRLATNRFVNRTDNFVAVEPQVRNKALLINVRGLIPTRLAKLRTMNGYTAFKLESAEDLDAVVSAIRSATRKV
jgi:hypothetical protein